MARETITRRASDNEYLHKDFHGALSAGIEYLDAQYGPEAVRKYLRRFARSFYAPLTEQIRRRGLDALRQHIEAVYRREGGRIRITAGADEMVVEVSACPAVTHMRQHGYAAARLFHETIGTVNRAICDGTEFDAELVSYDQQTGRSVQRFFRRES